MSAPACSRLGELGQNDRERGRFLRRFGGCRGADRQEKSGFSLISRRWTDESIDGLMTINEDLIHQTPWTGCDPSRVGQQPAWRS
jgi:hypothetical protein